jgi:hypothetical protein
MALQRQRLSWRARILLASGCLCLALGSGLPSLAHPRAGVEQDWFDAARGILLGAAVGLNLAAVMDRRRHSACS